MPKRHWAISLSRTGGIPAPVRTIRRLYTRPMAVLDAATEVKVWELQDLEALPTWTRGRAMLIGDAAHAMTPMQGQGANMSIEDAESLRLLTPNTRREDVQDILKVAESVRRPRLTQVLAETRKSHSTLGLAERVVKNLEFNCGYRGVHEALKIQQREGEGKA
ncbi:MAG: hypothetical protein Q9160_007572 [Pyrenula sp. 1 TL-2023]